MVSPGENNITLQVSEALPKDSGRGIVRIDPADFKKLNLEVGSFVLIIGQREISARVLPTYPEQRGRNIIQMDGITRENAKVSLGDHVKIGNAEVVPAASITLAPLGKGFPGETSSNYIGKLAEGISLGQGDKIRIVILGLKSVDFVVLETVPRGFVYVHGKTQIKLQEEKNIHQGFTRLSYEDIGGLSKQLARVREMIELPLKHPELFERLGVEPPKGVLLTGPPGAGKTLIAKAVAAETKANFIHVNGPEIIHKFYGESEAKLREIFDSAGKHPQSIIFLDEIDAIAPKREDVTGEVEKRVVAQLLALMDGLKDRGQIVVIGATNLPNNLDPALRRPGRFDREISIGVPDRKGRLEILHIHTRGMPLLEEVDLNYLAEITHGFVGADLQALAKEAAMHCLRRLLPELTTRAETISEENLLKIKVQMADFDHALQEIEPSATRELFVEIPNVSWGDIGGYQEIKKRLQQVVEWPFKYRQLFQKAGVDVPQGILLAGPPGTGKTLLAKAVANECGLNFISIKGPALLSKWVGESEKAIRNIFKTARQAAPCIIFFDEIDSLVPKRGSGDQVNERMVSQLLTEIDGVEELRGVVLLAATNRKDLIDAALLRPGRFDVHLDLSLPDKDSRLKIYQVHTKQKNLFKDIDLEELAGLSEGFSGAHIRYVCQRSAMLAIEEAVSNNQIDGSYLFVKKKFILLAVKEIKKNL